MALGCSKNSTEPDSSGRKPDDTTDHDFDISGMVYKITESGQFPASNTPILVDYAGDSIKTVTDETGYFCVSLPDTIANIDIVIQDKDFFRLDTTITDLNHHLNFYLSQIIYYLPAMKAAKWRYHAFYGTQAASKLTEYDGIESWAILSFIDSTKTGLMKCQFEGMKYNLEWQDIAFDTISVEYAACTQTYNFKLGDGVFICAPSIMTDCATIFDHLVGIFAHYPLIVGFPPHSADTVVIDNSIMLGRMHQWYEIQRDIGLVAFAGVSDHIWGGESIQYELVNE